MHFDRIQELQDAPVQAGLVSTSCPTTPAWCSSSVPLILSHLFQNQLAALQHRPQQARHRQENMDSISTTHRFATITEQGQIITSISKLLAVLTACSNHTQIKRKHPTYAIKPHEKQQHAVRCVKWSQPLQHIATDLCNNNHNMQPDRFTDRLEHRSRHRAFSCSNQLRWWLPCWI